MKKKAIFIIVILLIIGFGASYYYSDMIITEAIISLHDSREILDTNVEDINIYTKNARLKIITRLENPTNFDIFYTHYSDIYYEDKYITTINYETTVPAKRTINVESTSTVGTEGYEVVETLSYYSGYTLHYKGQFTGRGKFLLFTISKSWTDEWDYVPE